MSELLETLKELDQWVCWKYEERDGEKTKPPIAPHKDTYYAKSNASVTWGTYERARKYADDNPDIEGVGFALSKDDMYVGVDLDGCRDPETGEIEPWAQDIVDRLDTYTEVSPSGTGLRGFVLGVLPDGRRTQKQERTLDALEAYDKNAEVEIYDSGRYMTFTGNHIEGTPMDVQQRPQELKAIHADYVAEEDDDTSADVTEFDEPETDTTPENADVDLTDEEVIEKAKNAANGDKFERLYRGDDSYHGGDTSEADLAFCQMLAFWTGGDSRQIDRIFRNSGRMRDKWDETHSANGDTYGEMTISEALSNQTDCYDPETSEDATNKIDCKCGASAYRCNDEEIDGGHKAQFICPDCGRKATIAVVEGEERRRDWETPSDREDDTETTGSSYDWDYVRQRYKEEGAKVGRQFAADALEAESSWMYVIESETLWVYDPDTGYFNPWGEERAARTLERRLGTNYSRAEVQEVVSRLQARNQTHREELNARNRSENLVCVGNGVLNVRTGELRDHNPKYQFTRGVPHDYDPEAVPERTLRFLRDVTKRDADMWTLIQQLGHGLLPGHPYKAFVVMFGPGDNGKSAVGRLFRRFVGDENAASVELRDFREDDFATGDLPGKMINVGDDLSGKKVRDVSMLKRLTGGDTLRANEKHKATFDFQNEAAMFFSGNEPPVFEEQTDALKGRLYPIHMPFKYTQESNDGHKDADPHLVDKIATDEEEMSGLLNLAVQGAQDLIESGGDFAMPESPQERMEIYEAASDPIRRFVMDYLEQGGPDDVAKKDDVYDVYAAMCRAEDERAAKAKTFKSEITQQAIVDVESGQTRTLTEGDAMDTCWKYIRFSPDATEYMSDRLKERYFDNESVESDDEDPDSDKGSTTGSHGDDDGTPAFGATPISEAAEALTGYVTVTAEVVTTDMLGEDNAGTKAVLKDETGAIDMVAWEGEFGDRLKKCVDETVVIRNAEVTEYNGTRQLSPVDGLTSIETIQQGVGYTAAADAGSNAQINVSADGGVLEPDEDGADPGGETVETTPQNEEMPQKEAVTTVLASVEMLANSDHRGAPHEQVLDEAVDAGLSRDRAAHLVDTLLEDGRLTEQHEDHYRTA